MEYYLNRINIVFIALVGALCVWQWSGEKRADGEIEKLRQAVAADERHVAAQDQAIHGANEDIDEFKKLVNSLKTKADAGDLQIRQQKARIFTLEQESRRHDDEADVWKKTISAYRDAVAGRDGNIHLLLDQREKLIDANKDGAAKANKAVIAYNDLAAKYGDLVSHYNDLAKRYQAEHPPAAEPAARPST